MSENWDIYMEYIEGKLASFLLDMDIWKEIDIEKYKHCFYLELKIKEPNEDGFPFGDESEKLNEVEDSFTESLGYKNNINVGRITTNGVRKVIYYSTKGLDNNILEVAKSFIRQTGYQFNIIQIVEKNAWEYYYNFLYPSKYQKEHMANRKVVDSLVSHGDKLEESRKVEHWLYFNNGIKMKLFVDEIQKMGYNIESINNKLDEEVGKYMLIISRIELVDYNSINKVTDFLLEILKKYEGEYNGWETYVIK
jgi:uncharacterized protein (TIGR01619 family)